MRIVFSLLLLALLATACADRDKKGNLLDQTTYGTITIAVDESLKPLIDAEADTFEATYRDAHLNIIYTTEDEAIQAMLQDSARLAIVTRSLTEEERAYLRNQKIDGKEQKIAKGGVALIVNRLNPDTLLTVYDFRKILTGTNNLSELDKNFSSKPVVVVFDHPNSGIIRYLRDSVQQFDSLPSYCYAVNGNPEVIDYVSKNPQAIGLIDVNWISDRDDSTANTFLGSIKVIGLSDGGEYFQPYQAYIADRSYPLLRDIKILSREARMGLGTGFTAFVASERGQRIVLKSGIVPATMPIRVIQVRTEPFKP
ncbi:MAG TPA: substrate-binding domain-containing protein [Cyclobacteriaceae bacterium]|nr:substrate-binding domain-containing protein [Cyclobacteriaceae bacterium]